MIDDDSEPLLLDFGIARIKHEITRSKTQIVASGSFRYLAPELALAPSPDAKFRTSIASDCYALAMTILAIATLQSPFADYQLDFQALRAAEKGIRPVRPVDLGGLSSNASNALWVLLTQMWAHNAAERPGLDLVQERLENIMSLALAE